MQSFQMREQLRRSEETSEGPCKTFLVETPEQIGYTVLMEVLNGNTVLMEKNYANILSQNNSSSIPITVIDEQDARYTPGYFPPKV